MRRERGLDTVAAGKHNMIRLFASCAVGEPVAVDDPCGGSADTYLVRDIDTIPGVFSAGELVDGVERAPCPLKPSGASMNAILPVAVECGPSERG